MERSGHGYKQEGTGTAHDPTESALAGMLALLVEEREERLKGDKDATKTEVLLANAGPSDDIAAAMGKRPAAVRMAVTRKKKVVRKRAK